MMHRASTNAGCKKVVHGEDESQTTQLDDAAPVYGHTEETDARVDATVQGKSLGIFGSYVRNEQSRRSDMDILVEFEQPPDLFVFMELEGHLAKQLGVNVGLVPRRALKGEIGARILSEMITI